MTPDNWWVEPLDLEADRRDRHDRWMTPSDVDAEVERLQFREAVSRYEMTREDWDAVLAPHRQDGGRTSPKSHSRPPDAANHHREDWWSLAAMVVGFVVLVSLAPAAADLIARAVAG